MLIDMGYYRTRELPAVDERLVAPGSGYEIDDGKLMRVPPRPEPHAERFSKLAALLEAHVSHDFNVALNMLTRVSETTDIAPDASVYPRARDPKTGGRYLEHLAFAIVDAELLPRASRRAAQLTSRGVRRVFAIDVGRSRAMEWSRELESWSMLDSAGQIVDPTLAVALPISAIMSSHISDFIAEALLAKHNQVFEAARVARFDAKLEAEAEAVVVVLMTRGLVLTDEQRVQILAERDPAKLTRWLVGAVTCADIASLLRD